MSQDNRNAYNLDDENDTGCECMCDTREAHETDREESERAFLADPGPPPAGWSIERVARAEAGMAEARARTAAGAR